jgi:hypothetical protein
MTTPPNKTKLKSIERKFNLKFLLTGNSEMRLTATTISSQQKL